MTFWQKIQFGTGLMVLGWGSAFMAYGAERPGTRWNGSGGFMVGTGVMLATGALPRKETKK